VTTAKIPADRLDLWQPLGRCFASGDDRFLLEDSGQRWPDPDVALSCALCPVAVQCLAYALANESDEGELGIWGGTTPYQRRQLKADRARKRCPRCEATAIVPAGRGEICLSCGVSWIV